VQNFVAPQNEGVVNHDSADNWTIDHTTVQDNSGAGLMAGNHEQVLNSCLRRNGQYAINAYKAGGLGGLVLQGDEITGNNTDNWEQRQPDCGCSGGVKFWAVNGADVRDNWVHDNRGVGLWADTNDNDFLIEDNLIENNDGAALIYEASYNAVIRNNTIRRNNWVSGRKSASGDDFPYATIYLSESGGEPRIPARTSKIEIYGNLLQDNWNGITLWENADRFCNSPANTSSGDCTLLVKNVQTCSPPAINSAPLHSDCRWKTQRVDIHDNKFVLHTSVIGCDARKCGLMAVLSNYGTYPDWSPYKGEQVESAITSGQQNLWHNNSYSGPWEFVAHDADNVLDFGHWQGSSYQQDKGSSYQAGG
jgi:hypothetical protein